jgi:membrane fusion protein, heavy metal efflux system
MRTAYLTLSLLALIGCEKKAITQKAAEPEVEPEAVTNWSEKTELFMEHPPLVAGQDSRFAIHLTRLDNFKAVGKGKVEVQLIRAGSPVETFSTDAPSRPGIFGVTVKPAQAASYKLVIRLTSSELNDVHEFEAVPVAASPGGAPKPQGPELADLVPFLKEQQWALDFATSVVSNRDLRTSIFVPAEVTARSSGEADVTVPFNGQLVGARLPVIGEKVSQGQLIANLVPPTSAPNDISLLELAKNESSLALQLARKDRERAERLVQNGAAPAKRLEEARTVEATAEARLKAAESRLAQFDASRSAEFNLASSKAFALRAPIAGVIQLANAAPGANVKSGDTLFKIVDLDRVYVSAIVPESELPLMQKLSGAELEVPGSEQPRRLSRLISVGRVVDSPTRTFPVIYEVDNADRRIAINQTVYVRLLTQGSGASAAVPESAIIDDAGRPIVFVQMSGEEFQRRTVRLGVREGGYVQILDGVRLGERVVSQGGHLIRLAAMSSQVPAHGHVH